MIPFLGINLTKNPNNEQTNGNEFLIKKTPAKLTAEIQNQTAKLNDMSQKSQTSPVFSFIQYSTVTIFILIIASIFGAELSFVEEYHHTPWLYWFAAVFGIIGLSLSILSKRKSILFQRASEPLLSQLEDYLNDVDRILDVPDSAKEIDIFSFTYTITNNQIKIIKNAFPTYQFSNCDTSKVITNKPKKMRPGSYCPAQNVQHKILRFHRRMRFFPSPYQACFSAPGLKSAARLP